MKTRRLDTRQLLALFVPLLALMPMVFSVSRASEPNLSPERLEVINQRTVLRLFQVDSTPEVITKEGKSVPAVIPGRKRRPIGEFCSPLPDENWRLVKFDDSDWAQERTPVERGRGTANRSPRALHTATRNALICARASFFVEDPERVKDLKLDLKYVGGAAVFVNGQEVARGGLPQGEIKHDTPANRYPDDLYVEPGNKYLQNEKQNPKGFARRYRWLKGVTVPAGLLRKGTNVLAVEIHRAPVNEAATKVKREAEGGMGRVPGLWAYAALRDLELSAAANSAVRSNVGRPKGIQVWNCLPFDTVTISSYGDPARELEPVEITAVRNGTFSGRLVVSSGTAISGFKAGLSELKSESGEVLPSGAVLLRVAQPAGTRFDGLVMEIPSKASPFKARVNGGAAIPLWITVKVPAEARPGLYSGTLTLAANGLEETRVPVKLEVLGWTLPDPKDFRVKHTGVLSPDSLALHYKVPYWSKQHFELMRKSMKLMYEAGSRQAIINLGINCMGSGNSFQSIVRWIKQPDGSYKHDFSALDRYLDLVAEVIGKPCPLRINCWGDEGKESGEKVSLLDPDTGKLTEFKFPKLGSRECYEFWKPAIDGVRERLKKRGWEDVASFGHNSYCYPPKPYVVDMANRLWPGCAWSYTAHNGTLGSSFKGTKGTEMLVRYSDCVWTEGSMEPRGYRRLLEPGREKLVWNSAGRDRHADGSTLRTFLKLPEEMILRGHDGVGYLSAELFPIENPRRKGRYYRLSINRGGVSGGKTTKALLAPGSDGPVPSERYEMLREGVQLCEAVLYLQKMLDARKIGGDLAARVNKYLDARGQAFVSGWNNGRRRRDRQLYELCAEAAGTH